MSHGPIGNWMLHNYRHYNAASVIDAAKAFEEHISSGKKMILAMGGAMSTAEIGVSLAEMIRQDKFHAISCSANNGEEDIFNLVANQLYYRIPNYRDLTPEDEQALVEKHFNRVTDTCIPEEEAFRRIQKHILSLWKKAAASGERYYPYEYFYKLLLSGVLEEYYADNGGKGGYLKNSWLYAAAQKGIPVFFPGWEDSTLGNIFTGYVIRGEIPREVVRHGVEQMELLAKWYPKNCVIDNGDGLNGVGFMQLCGGIAGDFPICVVPMLQQDMQQNTPLWSYFCQVTDCNESYGSYSGSNPAEKITWGKLSIKTPKFTINSDATVVAPLIFAFVLGM